MAEVSLMVKRLLQVLVTGFFLILFVYQAFFQHGKKVDFGPNEVYYKGGATEAEALRVGEVLEEIGFFSPDSTATVQLLKEDDVYVARFVVKDSVWDDKDIQEVFSYIGYFIGALAFPDELVAVQLCDDELTPKITLSPKEPPDDDEEDLLESEVLEGVLEEESGPKESSATP